MKLWLMRFVPDVESAFQRFPVTVLFILAMAGIMFANATSSFTGPIGSITSPGALPPRLFALAATLTGASFAIERVGAARRWSMPLRVALSLAAAALVVGLHALPLFAPTLSALWLPIDPGFFANGVLLLALASMAAGTRGEQANTRLFMALVIAFASWLVAWFVISLVHALFDHNPGLGFQASRRPPLQVAMLATAALLALSWLATAPDTSGDDAADVQAHQSMLAQTEVLRRLLLPALIVLVVGIVTSVAMRLSKSGWPLMDGVPRIVGPTGSVLFLLTVASLHARALGGNTGSLIRGFATIAPLLLFAVAVIVGYGLWLEVTTAMARQAENTVPMTGPLSAPRIGSWLSSWAFAGALSIVLALLAATGLVRDLKWPLVVAGLTFITMGVGPLSIERQRIARSADVVEKIISEAGLRAGGRIKPATEAQWSLPQGNAVRTAVLSLYQKTALGALAPLFAGSADDPFAQSGRHPAELANAVLGRLGLDPVAAVPPAPGTRPVETRYINLPPPVPTSMPLSTVGFDTMAPVSLRTRPELLPNPAPILLDPPATPAQPKDATAPVPLRSLVDADGMLIIDRGDKAKALKFDLRPLLKDMIAHDIEWRAVEESNRLLPPGAARKPIPAGIRAPRAIESTSDSAKARLIVASLSAVEQRGSVTIQGGAAWLLYNLADLPETKP